jgi:fructose-bisphosphate aldolase class II
MPLIPLSKLLADARAGRYAVGYFESWDTYSLEAVLEAAEDERSPVVLGFGGMMMDQAWLDRFGIEPLGAYGRVVAQRAKVPVALLLNEVWELEHAQRGVLSGFNAVMLGTSHLPFEENVELTRQIVEFAHSNSVEVQAELGRLPTFGENGEGALTDPDQAREFVQRTGVDCLAVSIGNVHLQTEGKAPPDMTRLEAIREKVSVPLVMHGGSGFPDQAVREAVRRGVALFHIGTILKRACLTAAQSTLNCPGSPRRDYQGLVGSRKPEDFLIPGKRAIKAAVQAGMRLYGSADRADRVSEVSASHGAAAGALQD